jgi:threonine dehydratase
MIRSERLSSLLGRTVLLKLETMSPVGSFKWRGATNKIMILPDDVRSKGVCTHSTGNHAMAVAYAARQIGVPASVFVPSTMPAAKLERLQRYGASIDTTSDNQEAARTLCEATAKDRSLVVVDPFDDLDVIAGQGTIALEILECVPDVDSVMVPVSGGGLMAGMGVALRANATDVVLHGVSASQAPSMYESLRSNRPVAVEEGSTIADSLLGGIGSANRYTFDLIRQEQVQMRCASEEEIALGMSFLMVEHGMVVEGAGAVGVAAVLTGPPDDRTGPLVIIVTGQNVGRAELAQLFKTESGALGNPGASTDAKR